VVSDGTTSLTRALEELTSPPEGLFNAGFASSSFRNDGQLELLELFEGLSRERTGLEMGFRQFGTNPVRLKEQLAAVELAMQTNQKPLPPDELQRLTFSRRAVTGEELGVWVAPFLVANFELEETASTSWYLTGKEKQAISDRARKGLGEKIRRVLRWWTGATADQ
jgi:hypothetical protein